MGSLLMWIERDIFHSKNIAKNAINREKRTPGFTWKTLQIRGEKTTGEISTILKVEYIMITYGARKLSVDRERDSER